LKRKTGVERESYDDEDPAPASETLTAVELLELKDVRLEHGFARDSLTPKARIPAKAEATHPRR
jgi:hypothetical protein